MALVSGFSSRAPVHPAAAVASHLAPNNDKSTLITALAAALGDITAAELGQVMRELGLNPSNEELEDLVNEVDVNKDGVISFEGIYLCLPPSLTSPSN